MATTLKELARELELDHSTVAYALSGKGSIKEATRQRVRDKATELGYVPNSNARRMRAQKTHNIGLAVPDVVLLYNELVQHLFRGAIARQYELQIALTEFDEVLEDRALRSLLEARVDGLIIKSRYHRWDDVPENHALRQVVARGVPAVLHGTPIEGCDLPTFPLPQAHVGEMATQHLLDLGHRRFAWLIPVEREKWSKPQTKRIAGSRRALANAGLDLPENAIFTPTQAEPSELDTRDGYRNYVNQSLPRVAIAQGAAMMKRALQLEPRPTAIICQNEATAIGAMNAAREIGLEVPRDFSVVATNHTLVAELAPVSLTTVDVPYAQVANQLLNMLFELMDEKIELSKPKLEPFLHLGASSAPPT